MILEKDIDIKEGQWSLWTGRGKKYVRAEILVVDGKLFLFNCVFTKIRSSRSSSLTLTIDREIIHATANCESNRRDSWIEW